MANNRMYLQCTAPECKDADKFFLGKYYPSQGWYINREGDRRRYMGEDLDQWLDQHKHYSLFGHEIVLVYEVPPT